MMQRTPGMNARGLPDTPVMNTHGGRRPAAVFSDVQPCVRSPAGNGEYDAAAAHDGEFAAIAAAKSSRERGRVGSSIISSRALSAHAPRSTLHAPRCAANDGAQVPPRARAHVEHRLGPRGRLAARRHAQRRRVALDGHCDVPHRRQGAGDHRRGQGRGREGARCNAAARAAGRRAARARARPARNFQGLGRPPPRRSSVSTARRAR